MTTSSSSIRAPSRSRLACLATIAAVLAACGGGGDGSSGDPLVPSAATITAANYEGVARQVLAATSYMGDATGLVTGAQVAPGPQALFGFARAQVRRVPGLFANRVPLVNGVVTTDTLDCTSGGSVTVRQNDVNGNGQVDVGDAVTLTARNCVEDGATLSGALDISFSAVNGDLDSDVYSATVSITLKDLRAATPAGNATGSGQFTLAISSANANTSALALDVSSMAVSGSFGGTADTVTMQNFSLSSSTALSGGRLRTTTSVSGTVGSNNLAGGTVTLATGSPLVQFDGDLHPSSGQITATGAARSQMRLTVQSVTNVLLELDANGDGSFESSTVKTWASLV